MTEAFDWCHEAHRLDPTNAEAFVQRARMAWELDDRTDADSTGEREVALREALKSIGDNVVIAAAHAQLANICLHKERRVWVLQPTAIATSTVVSAAIAESLANNLVGGRAAERRDAPRAEGDPARPGRSSTRTLYEDNRQCGYSFCRSHRNRT